MCSSPHFAHDVLPEQFLAEYSLNLKHLKTSLHSDVGQRQSASIVRHDFTTKRSRYLKKIYDVNLRVFWEYIFILRNHYQIKSIIVTATRDSTHYRFFFCFSSPSMMLTDFTFDLCAIYWLPQLRKLWNFRWLHSKVKFFHRVILGYHESITNTLKLTVLNLLLFFLCDCVEIVWFHREIFS